MFKLGTTRVVASDNWIFNEYLGLRGMSCLGWSFLSQRVVKAKALNAGLRQQALCRKARAPLKPSKLPMTFPVTLPATGGLSVLDQGRGLPRPQDNMMPRPVFHWQARLLNYPHWRLSDGPKNKLSSHKTKSRNSVSSRKVDQLLKCGWSFL